MIIKPISNTVQGSSASNIYGATAVYAVNTGSTLRTITIANTVSHVNGGGLFGTDDVPASQATVTLGKAAEGGSAFIIRKQPTDTVQGGHNDVKFVKVADTGG